MKFKKTIRLLSILTNHMRSILLNRTQCFRLFILKSYNYMSFLHIRLFAAKNVAVQFILRPNCQPVQQTIFISATYVTANWANYNQKIIPYKSSQVLSYFYFVIWLYLSFNGGVLYQANMPLRFSKYCLLRI